MSVSGFNHENPRVRFEALQATLLLVNDLSPLFQKTFHGDILPILVRMMKNENNIKM